MKPKLPGSKTVPAGDGDPFADADCRSVKEAGSSQLPGIETESLMLTPDESLAMAKVLVAPGEPSAYTRAAARRYLASYPVDKAKRKAALDELTEHDEALGLR